MILRSEKSVEWIKADSTKFVGDVDLARYLGSELAEITLVAVRFSHEARTNWHSHSSGQILWIAEGEAIVVDESQEVVRGRAGDAIYTPAGIRHWHGSAGGEMTHLSITNELVHDWGDPVDSRAYIAAVAATEQP